MKQWGNELYWLPIPSIIFHVIELISLYALHLELVDEGHIEQSRHLHKWLTLGLLWCNIIIPSTKVFHGQAQISFLLHRDLPVCKNPNLP